MLQQFLKIQIHNTKDFISIIQLNLSNFNIFTDFINRLNEFETFYWFIDRVFNVKTSKIQKIFQNKTITALTQLRSIQQHLQSIELKEKQLERQKLMISKQEEISKDFKTILIEQKKS